MALDFIFRWLQKEHRFTNFDLITFATLTLVITIYLNLGFQIGF